MNSSLPRSTAYWNRLANFGALCALILALTIAVLAAWRWYGESFIGYYAPARIFLSGENPYDYAQIVATIINVTGRGGNSPFYYPLWIAFPLFPLVTFPFQWSRLAWLVASILSWAMAIWVTEQSYRFQSQTGTRWLVWLFAFVLLGWFTLKVEQVAFLLFLDLAICLWAIEVHRVKTASLALALLLTKPTITFLPFAFLVVYMWWKDKRIAVGAMVSIAILLAISTVALPNWWSPIIEGRLPNGWNTGLTGYDIDSRRLTTTTLDFLDYNLGIRGFSAIAIQASVGLIALGLIFRWRKSMFFAVALATTLGFLLTPYAMQYDYALLTPALLWVLQKVPQRRTWKWAATAAGLTLLLGVLFWERAVSDGLWIPIITLLLLLLAAPSISDVAAPRSSVLLKNEIF